MTTVLLQPEPTFEAPVSIYVPGKGPADMRWTFKFLDTDALDKVQKKWGVADLESASLAAASLTQPGKNSGNKAGKKETGAQKEFDPIAYLMEFVAAWELPEQFTKANIETFFKFYPASWREVLRVHWAERAGAPRKN